MGPGPGRGRSPAVAPAAVPRRSAPWYATPTTISSASVAPSGRSSVKLDGTGGPGSANAWIERTLTLPAGATTLRALTTAHNRNGADSAYRVRLVDESDLEHVLIDWATSSGAEDAYGWFAIEAPIAAFAGTTVTLYFEGADNGPGIHEQRYYDDIGNY